MGDMSWPQHFLMSQIKSPSALPTAAFSIAWIDGFVYFAIACTSILLWRLCTTHVAALPALAPWDFSFVEFWGIWLFAWWYLRGLARTPSAARPSLARRLAFFAGLGLIYAVLETHFEFLGEHQFFYNRMMHAALHHFGPFLLALSWPGEEC